MRTIRFIGLFLLVLLTLSIDVEGQCAMCASQVESARQGGSQAGASLNDGILYLLALPFVAVGIISLAFLYHKNKFTR